MEWLTGLNSVRLFAIVLVVVYHLFRNALPGGFIAVEIFFTISGFLIFRKLVTEYDTREKILIGKYLKRRFLRIFPSLLACIVFTLALSFFLHPDLLAGLQWDTLAAGTFTTNLVELVQGGSYENTFAPNLFEQTWFLGLEMQLCLIAPFISLLFLNLAKKRKQAIRVLGVSLLTTGLLSGVLMALYGGLFGQQDRAYFAPDTHAMAFLLGGAYAVFNHLVPRTPRTPKAAPAIGLALSLAIISVLATKVSYSNALSFYFAMPFTAFLAVVMLACIVKLQHNHHARRKKNRALQIADYLGSLSFGIYLYHWPLYLALPHILPETTPAFVGTIICLGGSVLATILTGKILNGMKIRPKICAISKSKVDFFKRNAYMIASRVLVVLALAVPCGFLLYRVPQESEITRQLNDSASETELASGSIDYISHRKLLQNTERVILREFELAADSREGVVSRPYFAAANANTARVLVIGDSVTLGAKEAIEQTVESSFVDAKESRGIESASRILAEYSATGRLPDIIVISLATNERTMTDEILQSILNVGGEEKRYIFVTGYAGPQQPRETQNAALKAFAESRSNVEIADWWTVSHSDWSLMYADHIHLNPEGRAVYADLIKSVVERHMR